MPQENLHQLKPCPLIKLQKSKNKIRLDLLLIEKRLVPTRTKAQALILSGRVVVNGRPVTKAGTLIHLKSNIILRENQPFVSRGGEKLEGALKAFSLIPKSLICLDIGASTGGFTDCLLKNGAKKVYAVDVGHGQLDLSLRKNPQVLNLEGTHILDFRSHHMESLPTFVVVDVSFISLKKVLAHVKIVVPKDATVVALIKPQFEVGPKFLKKGVVRLEEIRQKAIQNIIDFAKECGYAVINQSPSVLKGPKGNQEHFVHLKT